MCASYYNRGIFDSGGRAGHPLISRRVCQISLGQDANPRMLSDASIGVLKHLSIEKGPLLQVVLSTLSSQVEQKSAI